MYYLRVMLWSIVDVTILVNRTTLWVMSLHFDSQLHRGVFKVKNSCLEFEYGFDIRKVMTHNMCYLLLLQILEMYRFQLFFFFFNSRVLRITYLWVLIFSSPNSRLAQKLAPSRHPIKKILLFNHRVRHQRNVPT